MPRLVTSVLATVLGLTEQQCRGPDVNRARRCTRLVNQRMMSPSTKSEETLIERRDKIDTLAAINARLGHRGQL